MRKNPNKSLVGQIAGSNHLNQVSRVSFLPGLTPGLESDVAESATMNLIDWSPPIVLYLRLY